MKKILIAEKTTPDVREKLLAVAADRAELVYAETERVTREQVLDCDALFGNVDPRLLEDAPRLPVDLAGILCGAAFLADCTATWVLRI